MFRLNHSLRCSLILLFLVFHFNTAYFCYSSASESLQPSNLLTLLGPKAYEVLDRNLDTIEIQYLDLLVQRSFFIDDLIAIDEFKLDWDINERLRLRLLSILKNLIPVGTEIYDLESVLQDTNSDPDLKELATEELTKERLHFFKELENLKQSLWDIAIPTVTGDIILEILPADGRPASSLAVGTLAQFYKNLADSNGWSYEVISSKEDETYAGVLIQGGVRLNHAFIKISGPDVFRKLILETGVHRFIFKGDHIQQAPFKSSDTHTKYSQVRIYPTPKPREFNLDLSKIEFQFVRSSGPGGQHVNKTSSAVHALHTPSGIRVFVQQERKQHLNKDLAIEIITNLLYAQHLKAIKDELTDARQVQQLSDTNSPYVRTYNFSVDPKNTYDILNGNYNPESFNGWEDVLKSKLETLIDDLVSEIQGLQRRAQEIKNTQINKRTNSKLNTKTNMCSKYLDINSI